MKYRRSLKNGDELSILGFGCMRFPTIGGKIDEETSIKMIHDAIKRGVNYFDTAWPYHGGKSETLLGKALSNGLRERVKIATKLPQFMLNSLDKAKNIFKSQLGKLQTEYIDYYLLHMLADKAGFERMKNLGIISWLEDLKKEGVIKNLGFSFHGVPDGFTELVNAYNWDFCQIQYNYLDEYNQAGKDGLKLAASLGLPVIIMEPLRGGQLVNQLPTEIVREFRDYDSEMSNAEWSLRWIWNHPEVTVVLSGMSTPEQLLENIRSSCKVEPLTLKDEELTIYENVKKIMHEKTKVPCTTCRYCMPCPTGVNIPHVFSLYNEKYLLKGKRSRHKYMMELGIGAKYPGFASLCVECGKCEINCPQNIKIIEELKTVSKELEGPLFKPVVGVVRRLMRV